MHSILEGAFITTVLNNIKMKWYQTYSNLIFIYCLFSFGFLIHVPFNGTALFCTPQSIHFIRKYDVRFVFICNITTIYFHYFNSNNNLKLHIFFVVPSISRTSTYVQQDWLPVLTVKQHHYIFIFWFVGTWGNFLWLITTDIIIESHQTTNKWIRA